LTRLCVPEVGLAADARDAAAMLLRLLQDRSISRPSRRDELERLRADVEARVRSQVGPQMAYLDVIRELVPEDGVFVDEITQVGFASWYGFPAYRPRQQVSVGEMGTLGFGFATALGAAVANPQTKVVQVSGDGGFMFNVQELSVAVQYGLNVVTIIFNDNTFGNVQRQQDEWFGGRRLCSDLHNPDFARLAELFGAVGLKAADPAGLRVALARAMQEPGPVLIEVAVRERMPAPWPFILMPQNRRAVCG
jgi:acetolactate synthase-1/2/3 large subunit